MVQRVDLDETGHALSILHRLDLMKRDLRHCDFTVNVGENEYHTHRNILSAGSDYFDAMLTHDTKENQLGRVEMMDVDSECVKVCIDYIYTGKADIPDGKAADLMHVAHLMQLEKLCDGIAGVLENNLSIENIFETKVIAKLYDLEGLLAKCHKFTGENIAEVSLHSWFLDEPKQFLLNVVSSKNVSMMEELKLIVFLRWVKHKTARAEQLDEFIDLINLHDIPSSYRRHLVESEPLVMNNLELVKVISISIMDSVTITNVNRESFYFRNMAVLFDEVSGKIFHYNNEDNELKVVHAQDFKDFVPCTVVALCSHIYVLSEDVHRLKIGNEDAKWEKMPNMIKRHGWYPPAVSHDGSLYVIGGSCDFCTAASEQYLPDENKWVRLSDKPFAIEKATLVSLDEHIYCAGGITNRTLLKTFSRFTPTSSTWVDLPTMTTKKHSCGATAFNHNIYILGGFDGTTYYTDVDCFNVITSQWTSLPPMSVPRGQFSVLQFNGVIYVFGGDGTTASQFIEKYDLVAGTWVKIKIKGNVLMHHAVRI